ncbi:MAG: histidine kinase [Cyclobacteriaceae bacterium]|jgi:two-component sensor histidine kinase|nr:histidine kinase [Cyclobacteriaceae bacterium]
MNFSIRTKVIIGYLLWSTLWAAEHAYIIYAQNYTLQTALTDALLTQVFLGGFGYVVHTLMKFYQPGPRNTVFVIGWIMLLAFASTSAQQFFVAYMTENELYSNLLHETYFVRLAFNLLMLMLFALLTWFWAYVNDKNETENRKKASEELARQAELTNLRMQLQPHFLFNSLNSIQALVLLDADKAQKMVQQLSDFLRGTMRKENQYVLLEEELKLLSLYLEIEKVRFGHRLSTAIITEDDTQQSKIPTLLLQPIVENSIKFGLYGTLTDTTISLRIYKQQNDLIIEVKNPFDADSAASMKGTGFGLQSLQRRLFLLYNRNDLLKTEQKENNFITTVRIPQG